jgi:PAS domain S-box-containing protein
MVRDNKGLVALCLMLAVVIFLVDSFIPLGVAGGVPYVSVVLISLWSSKRSFTIYITLLCSVLVVLGYFTSPSGGELWKVLSNRLLAEAVIWAAALLGLALKKGETEIQLAETYLRDAEAEKTNPRLVLLCLSLAALIFLIDLFLPLGVAGGVLYVAVVLISLWSPRRSFTLYIAILCSALTIAGYFHSPVGGEHWKVLSNRFLAEMVIWTSTVLGLGRKSAEAMLKAAYDTLEDRVEERTSDLRAEVAERKRVEKELQLTQFTLDHAPDAVYCMEPTGQFIYVNETACRTLGYTREELLSMGVVDIDPSMQGGVPPEMVGATKQVGSGRVETEHRAKDGRLIPVDVMVSFIEYDGKEYHCCFTREITERKMAEEAQKESEERFRTLVDTLPHGVQESDIHGKITFSNRAHCIMHGCKEGELAGKFIFDFLDTEQERDGLKQYLKRLVSEQPLPTPYVSTYTTNDDTVIDVEVNWNYKRDEHGTLTGFISVITDITERKKAEEALRESEAQQSLLLDSTAEGIYGLDLDGRCMFANPACLRFLWYDDINDLIGKNMHELIHHTRVDGTPYPVEECHIYEGFLRGEGTQVDDEFLWRKDGTSFPAEYWSYPIRRDEKVVGSVVTFIDITERKRAESELKEKSEKLNMANKDLHELMMEMTQIEETEKKRFAELLHDDIGQNLVAVKMALSNTLKHGDEFDSATRERLGDANAILESTIGAIRSLSSDLYPVTPYVEGLIGSKGLIEAIAWHEKNILNPAGIETEILIGSSIEELDGDCKRQLYKIFQESFQNIIKHSAATKVVVYCDFDSKVLHISIKDNGKGFQNGDTGSKKSGGVGLRLMRERVISMGGELTIDSNKSNGAEIRAVIEGCWERCRPAASRGDNREE